MKRYNVYIQDSGPYAYIEAEEEKDGDYVHWEDVEEILKRAKDVADYASYDEEDDVIGLLKKAFRDLSG